MKHRLYNDVLNLVTHDTRGLHLIGTSGCGKSTLLRQVAEELNLNFYFINCTRQLSEGKLLGYNSVTSLEYSTTLFRKAVEEGGMFVFEEINAIDPNTLLVINSLDNGEMAFPDKSVKVHKDFRLCATSNPNDDMYASRDTLDFASKNRFTERWIDKDEDLALHLSDSTSKQDVEWLRKALIEQGYTKHLLTMRDEISLFNLRKLNLSQDPLLGLIREPTPELLATITRKWGYELEKKEAKRKEEERKEQERVAKLKAEEDFKNMDIHDVDNFDDFYRKLEEI